MFYEDVSPLIRCQMCQSKLVEAKILLCGHFCDSCLAELTKDTNDETREFTCKSCEEIHMIPKNGFKNWKALNEFYSKELNFEEIYRGESAENLKKNLIEIQKQIDSLNLTLANGVDLVNEHCLKLRNEVSLEAEITIKRIQDVRDDMIKEINSYEEICISNLKPDKLKKQNFEGFLNEMLNFQGKWNEYLKKYQINDAEIVKANKSALDLQTRFRNEKMKLDKFIFNDESVNFNKKAIKIEKDFLGTLTRNLDNLISNKHNEQFSNRNLERKSNKYDVLIDIDDNYFDVYEIIDLNQFKKVDILGILKSDLSQMSSNHAPHVFVIDSLEYGKLAAIHKSEPSHEYPVSISIIDKTRVLNSTRFDPYNDTDHYVNYMSTIQKNFQNVNHWTYLLKATRNHIVVYWQNQSTSGLALFNLSLRLICSSSIKYRVKMLDANEKNIFCLGDNYQVMVFDYRLNIANQIKQSINHSNNRTIPSHNPKPNVIFNNVNSLTLYELQQLQLQQEQQQSNFTNQMAQYYGRSLISGSNSNFEIKLFRFNIFNFFCLIEVEKSLRNHNIKEKEEKIVGKYLFFNKSAMFSNKNANLARVTFDF